MPGHGLRGSLRLLSSERKTHFYNLLCAVVLAAIPVLIAAPGYYAGDVPLDAHSVLFSPPWQEARPAGLDPAASSMAAQHAHRFYPWYRFLSDSARTGDSVLWNPDEAFGTPFLALWRSRALSPFSLPLYFFTFHDGLWASVLLKLIVAGLCAYYAARRFGLSPAMALFVGIAYQWSGPVYLWRGMPLSDAVPWLPLLLPCTEWLIRGQLRAWSAAALVLALIGLGGDPETLAGAVTFMFLYVLARCVRHQEWTHFRRALTGVALAALVALALIAVQLAPYIEYLWQSVPQTASYRAHLGLTDLAALLSPRVFSPGRGDDLPVLYLLYGGAAPLLLLPLWWSLRRFVGNDMRRRVESLGLAAVAMLLLALLCDPVTSYFSIFQQLGPQHFLIAHTFALAFLAAAAAEEWNSLTPDECRATLQRLGKGLPVFWGALFLLAGAWHFFGGASAGQTIAALSLPLLVALALLALLGITLVRPGPRATGIALCVITLISAWWVFRPVLPQTEGALAFPETSFVGSLDKMETRIGGSQMLRQWPLAGNGIQQTFNPSGVTLRRYKAFIDRSKDDPLLLRRTGAKALLLTKQDIREDFAAIRPLLNIQEVYPSGAILFRDLDARPRSRMIYAGRSVDAFDPAQLSSKHPPLIEGRSLPEHDEGPTAVTRITVPQSNTKITVQIEETRPGVLLLADAWYPGWTASVDGQKTPIFPVDGIFRGIEIGNGSHTVEFIYKPFSLRLGLGITALALLYVLLSFWRFYCDPGARDIPLT
jgi:hypothetical protein